MKIQLRLASVALPALLAACATDDWYAPVPASGPDAGPPPNAESTVRSGPPSTTSGTVVNGAEMSRADLETFRATYGVEPGAGAYWYDAASGLWGPEGGAAQGFLLAGMSFAPLPEDASRGRSAVVVNGRRLPVGEVLGWQQLLRTQVLPGRYWLDGSGNYGLEGYPYAAGNLLQLAATSGRGSTGGGGDNMWSSRVGAGNWDSSGAGYVSVPGHGPIGYGM